MANIETHYILYYPFYNHMIYVLCSLMCNYYGLNHVMIISKQSTFNICWDYFLNMKCTLQLGLYLTKSLHLYNICCWNMRRRHLFIKLFCQVLKYMRRGWWWGYNHRHDQFGHSSTTIVVNWTSTLNCVVTRLKHKMFLRIEQLAIIFMGICNRIIMYTQNINKWMFDIWNCSLRT